MDNKKIEFDEAYERMIKLVGEVCLIELPFVANFNMTHIYEHLKSFTSEYKYCWRCKERKTLAFFRYNGGLQSQCKTCVKLMNRPLKWAKLTNDDALRMFKSIIIEMKKLEDIPLSVLENANTIKNYFENYKP